MGERLSVQEKFARRLARRSSEVVLFEDADVMAVNKPAGLLSQRANGAIGVQEIIREVLGDHANIAHRLDLQTSGVLVVTRSRRARRSLDEQFKNKQRTDMKKLYTALVDGAFPSQDVVEAAVAIQIGKKRVQVVDPNNARPEEGPIKQSLTYFIPAIRYQDGSTKVKTLTGVEIVTGRTHQIRVVAAQYLGMPVVGDIIYNDDPSGAPRQMLHALQLSINLPGTGESVLFEAPIPDDFQQNVAELTVVK